MKRYTVFIFFLVINSVAVLPTLAQTKQLPEVSVDLGSGVTLGASGLPFDVPFRIKGTTTTSLRKISLTYQVSSSYDHSNRLQWKGNKNNPSIWRYMGDQPDWRLLVGPIHPNVPYDFIFTVTRIPDAKAPEKEKFKQEAYKILEAFYDDPAVIDEAMITKTNDELNVQLNALIPPGQKIIYPNGNPYSINITDLPFSSLLQSLKNIEQKQMSMQSSITSVSKIFTSPVYNAFQQRLANIINNTSLLKPTSKVVIDGVIDVGNPKYKAVKMIDIGILAIQPVNRIDDLFEGKLTLDNNVWVNVQQPDLDLMRLTYQFYYKLSDNLDMEAGGKAFTESDTSMMKVLLGLFKGIIATQVFNDQLTDTKNSIIAKFPDVLADKMLSSTYIVNDQSCIDAVSQSTPYIGLDVGLSYIPGYNQLFIYEGVNFYFMPVNKDAPLSYFTKREYWWLKRLSVHLGLTQNLIKVENKRYVPLIEGVGSLLVGAGLRINSIMRINAGYMFFYEKDNNPLIDKKHFTALPQFSFTFDINIARALGGFGSRLRLNP